MDNSENTQRIIAVSWHSDFFGVAIYDEENNELYVDSIPIALETMSETIEALKVQFFPHCFIIHGKIASNPDLMSEFKSPAFDCDLPFEVHLIKSSLWSQDHGVNLICNKLLIKSLHITRNSSSRTNFQKISSCVEIACVEILQSLGALLSFLQKNVSKCDDGYISINSISQFKLERYLRIDFFTMRSLQIFQEDIHPNVIKECQQGKEGFSLFSLLDKTKSLPGRRILRLRNCTSLK